jgi:hypothetical protein
MRKPLPHPFSDVMMKAFERLFIETAHKAMRDPIPCPMCNTPLVYFGEALMCSYSCPDCNFNMQTVIDKPEDFAKFENIVKNKMPWKTVITMANALHMVEEGATFTMLNYLGSENEDNGRVIATAVHQALQEARPYLPIPKEDVST